jgi:hypothetical protein
VEAGEWEEAGARQEAEAGVRSWPESEAKGEVVVGVEAEGEGEAEQRSWACPKAVARLEMSSKAGGG